MAEYRALRITVGPQGGVLAVSVVGLRRWRRFGRHWRYGCPCGFVDAGWGLRASPVARAVIGQTQPFAEFCGRLALAEAIEVGVQAHQVAAALARGEVG